jgi:hypothetical protein
MKWEGPISIGEVVTNTLRPPESQGLYVVSKGKWTDEPTKEAHVIYVGQAGILRRRVGELVAALLGFAPSGELRYLHGKGRRIFNELCHANGAESAKLYVGWTSVAGDECLDYEEGRLFRAFYESGQLLFKKVPDCKSRKHQHSPLPPIPK